MKDIANQRHTAPPPRLDPEALFQHLPYGFSLNIPLNFGWKELLLWLTREAVQSLGLARESTLLPEMPQR
jgi:hypothetical protein